MDSSTRAVPGNSPSHDSADRTVADSQDRLQQIIFWWQTIACLPVVTPLSTVNVQIRPGGDNGN